MHCHSRLFLLALSVVLTTAAATAHAQSSATLNALLKQRDAAIRELQTSADRQKADLFDKYANALDALTKQLTAKGDLDSVLVVRDEVESARTKRAVGAALLPALDSYRATLRKSLEAIEGTTANSQAQIDAGYIRSLNELKIALTKAGSIDDAVAVDKEIKNVTAGTAPVASTPPPAVAPPVAAAGKVVDLEKFVIGEATLPVGAYRPRKTVQIGGEDGPDKKVVAGTLHCLGGTQFDDASVFVRFGLLSAERTLFKQCVLSADLGGTIQAKDSLFSECQIKKGGAWGAGGFNSKWVFDNCAFSRSFAPGWTTTNIGMKTNHCTFHDIEFSGITYRADAGVDVAHAWFALKDCRFVSCTIPVSMFIATEDCVFEDCRFVDSKTPLPIATPIKLRAYVTDPSKVPPAPAMCTYELLDAKLASKEIGASLSYQKLGRTLKFQ